MHSGLAGGVYPRIEASFSIGNLATDPFDYAATDVQVQIAQPDGTTISLPAFFDGGTRWRVRHTPAYLGIYLVSAITLNGQPATISNLEPANWNVTGWPSSAGFVRVDPANPGRFVTSDGRRYFPLGHNVAWDLNSATNVAGLMAKLGAAGENWSRVWMDHWDGKNLDWPKVSGAFGALSLSVAQKWDAIVSAAEQAGIAFQMTLHHHGQYSSNVDPNWPQNPYNVANGGFLSDATQFFTNATAKALTKRKLRYAVARWGYSPAIMAWELFNEVQFTDAAQAGQWTNVAAWHNEMAQFIRSQDPYHHLVTTSSELGQAIWNQCDYYQHHDYPADLISALRNPAGVPSGQPVRPIFGGECGMDSTPYLGFQGPLWAGLMGAQSGAAEQWYWDHIDADNAYPLFRSARDFVLASGLPEQQSLLKSAPHVTCPINSSLIFAPGGGWATAIQDTFTIGDNAPDGIGLLPSYLQGNYHRSMTPNGYTFLVNYSIPGTFSVQVVTIAASGAGLRLIVDNTTTNAVLWPAYGTDISTNFTLSVPVPAGAHTLKLWNPGLDWVNLGNITLNPYAPVLGAYQIGSTNFAAVWLWHRTNIYYPNATSQLAGTFPLSGLQPGVYSATWWDTFAGVPLTNFQFEVAGTNTPTLSTPAILRSAAFYAGPPAQAGITPADFTQTLATNSSRVLVPLTLTNSGGLPLQWSLSVTGASPLAYTVRTSAQAGGPTYAWKDISSVGRDLTSTFAPLTAKNSGDEGIAGPIDIGFEFPFFSGAQSPGAFKQLYLSPNGFVSFSPFVGDISTNRALPGTLGPSNCIAFFWDDLDLSAAGRIYCATDSVAGAFTIQFQDAPIKATGARVTCQLVLKTSGEILMQYKSVGVSNACTVGLQNATRDEGLLVAWNQAFLQSGFALRLNPTAWLDVSLGAGLVPRWTAQTVEVAVDPANLGPGHYSANLAVQTADPALPLLSIPLELNLVSPIDLWRLTNFGTTANTGDAADSADPDGDGLVNLVEYALGLSPSSPDPNPLSISITAGHLTVSYRRPHPAPADINYLAEVSGTLLPGSWNSDQTSVSQALTENGDGTETVTATDLTPVGSATAHYLRLRFVRQ